MKHEQQSIAEHLPYPQPSTRSEASGITVPSDKQLLPRKCLRKAKQKDDLEMENGRRIRHAQEVCRWWRFSADRDIRQPVLPFVRFSSSSHTHRICLSRFYGLHLSCQSHSFLHSISLLFIVLGYLLSIIVVRINKSFVPFGNLGLNPLRLTTNNCSKVSGDTLSETFLFERPGLP